MSEVSWFLHIYAVSDAVAQRTVIRMLHSLGGMNVEAASTDGKHFVVVECADHLRATAVGELIMLADPGAELSHTARGIARYEDRNPDDERS